MIEGMIAAGVYLGLSGFAIQRRPRTGRSGLWLAVFCLYSVALSILHTMRSGDRLEIPAGISSGLVILMGFMLSSGLIGALTFAFLETKVSPAWWAAPVIVWAGALLGYYQTTSFVIPESTGASQLQFTPQIAPDAAIVVGGWLLIGFVLLGLTARAFLKATIPLYANRVLLWALVTPILLLGDALLAWFNAPYQYLGYGMRMAGTIGAVYTVTSHRGVDLRGVLGWLVNRSILTVVSAAIVFAGILAFVYIPLQPSDQNLRIPAALGIAIVVGFAFQPILFVTRWILGRLAANSRLDVAEAVRLYSQRITGVIELRELAVASTKTLNQLLNARRGYLLLVREYEDHSALEVIGRMWGTGPRGVSLAHTSPVYEHLMVGERPILQYDILYHNDYRATLAAEKDYFKSLEMDIYAPVISEGKLTGILALGPKTNDEPFKENEIELLSALAHQTVAALDNARLVSDLRSVNEKNRLLNEDLQVMNERLERMDTVKSDFISITSHELRTPLTQIQGYADLIREVVERQSSKSGDLTDMVARLIGASDRMTQVLKAMIDVAQIDVETMDMVFENVKLQEIIRKSIEPYQDAIVGRQLLLTTNALSTMPPIEGDSERLTQAFRNLVNNAIKFTPDGGKIDIGGLVLGNSDSGEPYSIQITIADTGIGIDKNSQQLIFEKFFRASPVEFHSTGDTKYKGAGPGLGLPIAKGIIEAHGGRVWVESPGYDESRLPGSIFHIVLPIHPPSKELHSRLQQLGTIHDTRTEKSTDPLSMRPGSKLRG